MLKTRKTLAVITSLALMFAGLSQPGNVVSVKAESTEGAPRTGEVATADLTDSGLDALSIYGSEDGVLNMEKYESNRGNLPENTVEVMIPGGNHAGFGCYGPQNGDGEAGISATEQIQYTAEVITAFVQ